MENPLITRKPIKVEIDWVQEQYLKTLQLPQNKPYDWETLSGTWSE